MNPSTGSFISMDSYTGSIYDPVSLHRYTYVKDNPVMYKDPSGYKPDSLAKTSIALGIREVLNHVVELNCIGILNSIINATAATLMGSTEDEMLKALFSGYIVGFGMTGLAYFVGAIYALSFAQIMLAEMAAGEAASFVMTVVSALDGDSSSVVQYEIMNMLYFMSGMLMYCGSLPKNDMTPSKNGWNCDVWNAGSQLRGDSPKGLIGKDFEEYLTRLFGGEGSFRIGGREFDGGVGNFWWEAKSGNYWNMLEENPNMLTKFKSDMGDRLRIAIENGATYGLFSNTPIPELIKQWLIKKGIPFFELLN